MTRRGRGRETIDWRSPAVVVAGVLIRLVLLPTDGLRGDIDQFVGWVHALAVSGLATLYSGTPVGPVAFGPVMAYVWAVLAAVQPAFATVTDSADPGIRALMKLPASLADLGLAAIVVFALRDRPRWAVIGAAAILLHPAVIYVSAWWGQYESIFLLAGLGAVVAAINGRNGLAAALVAAALMTKPQAVAFIVPFTAWFWASGYATAGVRGGVDRARPGRADRRRHARRAVAAVPGRRPGPSGTSRASGCTRPTSSGSCR